MLKKFWTLTDKQICDCEMILDKLSSQSIYEEDDYNSVLNEMRLASGELFPIPITLDVDKIFKT